MKIFISLLSACLIVAISGLIYLWLIKNDDTSPYFLAEELPKTHLIPNVTYYGQYLGSILSNQEPVAIRTILSYWGNDNISDETLNQLFEVKQYDPKPELNLASIENFFTTNNLKATALYLTDPLEIKSLIANNVPVYVQQQLASNVSEELYSTRVYIGYSDVEEVFIVHDNNFGNNFQISYSEFEKISDEFAAFIMVTPPNYSLSKTPNMPSAEYSDYPSRLGIMDDLELRDLQILIIQLGHLKRRAALDKVNLVDESVILLENIIEHPAFEKLHPAARYSFSYNLAGSYLGEKPNYERAIEILETLTLPLQENFDFTQPFGEWDRKMDPSVYSRPFWTAAPWAGLGFLYLKVNQPEKARSAFNKALELIPGYPEAIDGLNMIK